MPLPHYQVPPSRLPAHLRRLLRWSRPYQTPPPPARLAHSASTLEASQSPTGHAHPDSHAAPPFLGPTRAPLPLSLRPRPLHLGGAGAGSGCPCWQRRRLWGEGRSPVRAVATSWADPGVLGGTRGEPGSECTSQPADSREHYDRVELGPSRAWVPHPQSALLALLGSPHPESSANGGGVGEKLSWGASEGAIW